jgi:ergothioneine biosynthesis protein EgtB
VHGPASWRVVTRSPSPPGSTAFATPAAHRAGTLAEKYRVTRALSEAICSPLAIDDYQVQSVPEASPPKWHLAHVSWFFETFLLHPFCEGYRPFHPRFAHLFNSYYETAGTYHPRLERHTLSRPTVDEVYAYRAHVDRHMLRLIERAGRADDVQQRTVLGIHHEQQHQELLLMDIKRNFFANPLFPEYAQRLPSVVTEGTPVRWLDFSGGLKEIGSVGDDFCFDSETPRHKLFLRPYSLASRLTTNAEYLEFIAQGGYSQPQWWLSDGWRVVREQNWQAPLYWIPVDGEWHEMTLHGCHLLDPHAPVCHISYYEADAFARWRGARLPTEAELECAGATRPIDGSFLDSSRLHPQPARREDDHQWFGELWQWTASPYSPYPGFKPLAGTLGEYNGKFMANQFVLRGGCCVTPRSHMRVTYRNFFYPHDRWSFTGIRLARDAGLELL